MALSMGILKREREKKKDKKDKKGKGRGEREREDWEPPVMLARTR